MTMLQRAVRKTLTQIPYALPQSATRVFSTSVKKSCLRPTEADIVRDFRQGNFEQGIVRFCKRPRNQRSNALHETVILACAQVPDSAAAEAVLCSMPNPTLSAVSNVVTALCREENVSAAIDILEKLPQWNIPMDARIHAVVSRAAQKNTYGTREEELKRLDHLAVSIAPKVSHSSLPLSSAAGFFVEDGGNCEKWLSSVGKVPIERPGQSRRGFKRIMRAEASLRAARGNITKVNEIWSEIQRDPKLAAEVGIMATAVSIFISSGWQGGPSALNALMNWVQNHLYDPLTGGGYASYTENPSAMAMLLTSVTKAISAAARPCPELALSAFDALWEMELPRFTSSLPLSGAYFKVLQHAELSLQETRERIETIREHHIQLDEQGFSMALGAVLRCNARVVDKLAQGKLWIEAMRNAGIPLTVHTYNLFAGQLRYCNDPDMVTTMLGDMAKAGVAPTPVTYGLIFSACVIPGEYSSMSRKNALPVATWLRVLEAMEEHMQSSEISHTSNSRLSLARAYAHLGYTSKALSEFSIYLDCGVHGGIENSISRRELRDAFNQMIYNFAHCRDCSSDGPEAAMQLFEQMREEGFEPSDLVLDSLMVACIRMGDARAAVEYAVSTDAEELGLSLSEIGLQHLLIAQAELCDASLWNMSRAIILRSKHALSSPNLLPVLHKLVIAFARSKRREVCEDIMKLADIEVSNLDYILEGREFLRFRSNRLPLKSTEREDSENNGTNRLKLDSQEKQNIAHADRSRLKAIRETSVLPLV